MKFATATTTSIVTNIEEPSNLVNPTNPKQVIQTTAAP